MNNPFGIVFAHQLALMIETGLLTYKQYIPFCDEIIENMDTPPYLMIELAVIRDAEEARNRIYEYIADEADENFLEARYQLYAACLYVKYERQLPSSPQAWSVFLMEMAHYADAYQMLAHHCSYYYGLLDTYERSNDAKRLELRQSQEIRNEFASEIIQVEQWYEPFKRYE
ncbi:hypothetical protein [Paenibacillus kandeliae]|uniref:hypothetical protein n=1 Tax=Paenibacillus kandeliae TaxID=3231269 RepID=UPI0034576DAA